LLFAVLQIIEASAYHVACFFASISTGVKYGMAGGLVTLFIFAFILVVSLMLWQDIGIFLFQRFHIFERILSNTYNGSTFSNNYGFQSAHSVALSGFYDYKVYWV